jgi:hypothetical protein
VAQIDEACLHGSVDLAPTVERRLPALFSDGASCSDEERRECTALRSAAHARSSATSRRVVASASGGSTRVPGVMASATKEWVRPDVHAVVSRSRSMGDGSGEAAIRRPDARLWVSGAGACVQNWSRTPTSPVGTGQDATADLAVTRLRLRAVNEPKVGRGRGGVVAGRSMPSRAHRHRRHCQAGADRWLAVETLEPRGSRQVTRGPVIRDLVPCAQWSPVSILWSWN